MWKRLSGRQRRVLAGLLLANIVLLGSIGALALAPASGPTIAESTVPPGQITACQSQAARALAGRNVAGTVALDPDGAIDFKLSGGDPAEAWDAFTVAAALPADGCGPYDPIRVDVPDLSRSPSQRLVVEARWLDVQVWSQGRIDDETLSERTRRITYTDGSSSATPSLPRP